MMLYLGLRQLGEPIRSDFPVDMFNPGMINGLMMLVAVRGEEVA